MSYLKAMKHSRNVRKCRAQSKMNFGFSTLAPNERRKDPWFGSSVMDATPEERKAAYDAYHVETERMLKENPSLKLV